MAPRRQPEEVNYRAISFYFGMVILVTEIAFQALLRLDAATLAVIGGFGFSLMVGPSAGAAIAKLGRGERDDA